MTNRHYEPVRTELTERKRFWRPGSLAITANKEVRAWLNESTTEHWFFYEQSGKLWIAFCSKQDAVMWKLAWH